MHPHHSLLLEDLDKVWNLLGSYFSCPLQRFRTRKPSSSSDYGKRLLSLFLSTSTSPYCSPAAETETEEREMGRQTQSKHSTSQNTCFGLLLPWEKMLWGCTLAHNCPVCSVQMPQTTIAKCLSGFYEAWVGLFKNLDLCLSYLSVIQLHVAVSPKSLFV